MRSRCKRPWRVYRPGIVVGHSQTGQIDKIDGPYYFFKLIQKLRQSLPPWFPLIGLEGGYINLVPVDYVVAAMDHLAHLPGQDGQCFHLTDPRQRRVGEVLNLFARAGHAPTMAFRLDPKLVDLIPAGVTASLASYRPLQQVVETVLRDLRIPRDVLQFFNWQTRFDSTRTQRLLEGTDIRVPVLEDYAWRLWDYWERHLDPDLSLDRSLAGAVRGKVVLITGGSSGIGLAAAERCADAGATRPHRRARPREARGRAQRSSRNAAACMPTPATSPTRPPATRFAKQRARRARRRRLPRQQCRPVDPPLDRPVLRPLPRFRAHDAAQLLRGRAPDHGADAVPDRARRARRQHFLDRRAVERAAFLRLRRRRRRRWRPGPAARRPSTRTAA